MNYDYASASKSIAPCPVCGQSSFEPLASVDRYEMGITTVGCRACGLIQTNPRLAVAALSEFYRRSYREFYQGVVQPSDWYVRTNQKDVRLGKTVEFLHSAGLVQESGVVLDIGCSEGAFFSALRKAGFSGTLFGVEPNTEFRAYATAQYGATVHPTEFDIPDTLKNSVDLTVVNHVLEHLVDPVASLMRLRQFVKPGGCLYVDVPDAERYSSLNDLHVAHLYHFTKASLDATLTAAGFEVVSIEPYLPVHHPPSLRAIARLISADTLLMTGVRCTAPRANREAWKQVKRINQLRHRLALRRFLRRSSVLLALYTAMRRLVQR